MLIIRQALNGIITAVRAVLSTSEKVPFRLICKIRHGMMQTK